MQMSLDNFDLITVEISGCKHLKYTMILVFLNKEYKILEKVSL